MTKKLKKIIFHVSCLAAAFAAGAANAANSDYENYNSREKLDTINPLFFTAANDFLSKTDISFASRSQLNINQQFVYGMNSKLALSVDLDYRESINDRHDGFDGVGLGLAYRTSGQGKFITDLLAGYKFSGTRRVYEFANDVYYAGIRMGWRWSRITLAGELKTSWIFDNDAGEAFINFTPSAYFNITDTWSAGAGFDFKKSVHPSMDENWMNFMVSKRYERTVYAGYFDYGLGDSHYRVGFKLNILF
ncbi:MAG: hypothetical protein LBO08_02420 [Rickettsiales bacterium]|jgi:hypothetical protein|nr:hypothetical protein [Rickettsiales bacterium]